MEKQQAIENLANELIGIWTDANGVLQSIDTIERSLNQLMPGIKWFFVYDHPDFDLAIKVVAED